MAVLRSYITEIVALWADMMFRDDVATTVYIFSFVAPFNQGGLPPPQPVAPPGLRPPHMAGPGIFHRCQLLCLIYWMVISVHFVCFNNLNIFKTDLVCIGSLSLCLDIARVHSLPIDHTIRNSTQCINFIASTNIPVCAYQNHKLYIFNCVWQAFIIWTVYLLIGLLYWFANLD